MSDTRAQDPIARWFEDVLPRTETHPSATQDIVPLVMSRLPQGSPEHFHSLATLVAQAWGDESLRAALRAEPRAALIARGFAVPHDMRVEVVPLDAATLPTATSLALPLADPVGGSTPATAAAARDRLANTPWRWMMEGAAPGASDPQRAATARGSSATRSGPDTERKTPRFTWRDGLPRPAVAWAGVAAVLIVAWATLADDPFGWGQQAPLSGTASGTPPWPLLVAAVVAVVGLLWWSGRRGG